MRKSVDGTAKLQRRVSTATAEGKYKSKSRGVVWNGARSEQSCWNVQKKCCDLWDRKRVRKVKSARRFLPNWNWVRSRDSFKEIAIASHLSTSSLSVHIHILPVVYGKDWTLVLFATFLLKWFLFMPPPFSGLVSLGRAKKEGLKRETVHCNFFTFTTVAWYCSLSLESRLERTSKRASERARESDSWELLRKLITFLSVHVGKILS